MKLVIPFHKTTKKDLSLVGGKAFALAKMAEMELNIPRGICITTKAYQAYLNSTGLIHRINMEVYRKPFGEMRWEEIWDAALRIRSMFLNTPMPSGLYKSLIQSISSYFSEQAVSVRSSAPGEDTAQTSFAGLHESFVNILGPESILEHILLVWASLWSDRALLYRQELGLDVKESAMAVIVQEMVFGEKSGVVFGMNPMDQGQAVVESVYGLNQGLVDGSIEPDKWILQRETGDILSHHAVKREKILQQGKTGARIAFLPSDLKQHPPLEDREVSEVFELALKAESFFGHPQDVEWTYAKKKLYTLQARPITTRSGSDADQRPWYLSLHRSFDNLKGLKLKIEKELIPSMEEDAIDMSRMDISGLSDVKLADEIARRESIYDKWQEVYKRDCIPFAHGMRLFGQVYNDIIKPKDPFEFIGLLSGRKMASLKRNRIFLDLAARIQKNPNILDCLKENRIQECDNGFREQFDDLMGQFGDLAWGENRFGQDIGQVHELLAEMASYESHENGAKTKHTEALEEKFLRQFDADDKAYAMDLMDLARASYQLRDDDNVYIGKIKGQLLHAISEGKKRIANCYNEEVLDIDNNELLRALRNRNIKPKKKSSQKEQRIKKNAKLRARQIVGQPAGPGVAFGKARVIRQHSDLFGFKEGEILVCDAIDPGMTFVVPLAAAIVERRGGMLIHGAIIAREYGIPCVTGASGVVEWIKTGDTVTVDGHLGIVVVGESGSVAVNTTR